MFLNYGVVFYVGAIFFKEKPFEERANMFSCVFALMFAGMGSG
jgi:hypothetical protein